METNTQPEHSGVPDGAARSAPATMKWTEAQRQGIETINHSLLVSAAAGSGKTSVLAERCVHLVCDVEPLCSIDELLVVTFTETAAAEMKSRIARALAARHARQPSDHTTRQLALIDRAHVGTLHGFCSRLLHRHFHLLGLDPDFVMLDADEAKLLKRDVARDLFADWYDRDKDSQAFDDFVDCYGDGKDEGLIELVLKAHETLCSVVDRTGWLERARGRIVEAIDKPLTETALGREYGKVITRHLEAMLAECAGALIAVEELRLFPMYVTHLSELHQILNHWISVFKSHGMNALVEEAATVELPDLPRVSNKIENKAIAKARVDSVQEAMKKGAWRQCLYYTEEEWKDGLRRTLPYVETFLSLVREFSQRYSEAKEEQGRLDFSDLERFTLAVLRDPDSTRLVPSPVARAYHRQFKHVLVDEYQDINEVQDAILSLVSRECVATEARTTPNLFCVGDVKQSIYRFRLAEPARFLDRRSQYSTAGSHGKLIDLQQNFRSRAPLLQAINGVFEKLMTIEAADLDYDASQHLKPGADYPLIESSDCFKGAPIELHLLPKVVGNNTSSDGDDDVDAVELDRTEREATLLARRILEMTGRGDRPAMNVIDRIGGTTMARPMRLGDIVILLRSMRYKTDVIAEVLRKWGIAVHGESATGYFEATEVNDILSLLKVLDNQRQDIPLAGLLRSPLAGLPDPDENLARIRLAYHSDETPVAFHEAVIKYAAEQSDEFSIKLNVFLRQVEEWRRLARQRPLAEMLWMIYDQTGYLAFCAGLPNGEQRQANLIELHERARQFGSFRRQGLGRFLEFLEKLKSEQDLGQASVAGEGEDVVRIMSIHRSKGQEFPVVLLPDLGKAINLQDCKGSILLDRSAGLGLQVIDLEKRIRYPSLASTVVQQRIKQQALAEELRVLYVAMTRAKEHLILVGTCGETQPDKWTGQWAGHVGSLPAEVVLNGRTMLDWIGPAAAALSNNSTELFRTRVYTSDEVTAWSSQQAQAAQLTPRQMDLAAFKPIDPPPVIPDSARQVMDRLDTGYAFEPFVHMAAAASVTGWTKQASAEPAVASPPSNESPAPELDRILPKPSFLVNQHQPDAADRGTATHAVLEWLDFTDTDSVQAIERQIRQMVDSGRISQEQSLSVDVEAIQWLMGEDVGRLLREAAGELRREVPVYYAIEQDTVNPSQARDPLDRVMIRGRLDVLVPRGDGFVIIDYKTDRVRGSEIDARAQFYEPQLKLYRQAIEHVTGRKVVETVIVFLHAKECRARE